MNDHEPIRLPQWWQWSQGLPAGARSNTSNDADWFFSQEPKWFGMGLFRTALQESTPAVSPSLCVIVSLSHFQLNFSTPVLLTGDDGHRTGNIRHDGEVHLPRPQDRRAQTARGCLLSGDVPQPCVIVIDAKAATGLAVKAVGFSLFFLHLSFLWIRVWVLWMSLYTKEMTTCFSLRRKWTKTEMASSLWMNSSCRVKR